MRLDSLLFLIFRFWLISYAKAVEIVTHGSNITTSAKTSDESGQNYEIFRHLVVKNNNKTQLK